MADRRPADFLLRIDHGRVRCTNAAGRSVDVGADLAMEYLAVLVRQRPP